jgi:hypothetical protein
MRFSPASDLLEGAMPSAEVHRCQCLLCQQEAEHPDQLLHHQMNVLLSRLDEQQRWWYAAVEANCLVQNQGTLLAMVFPLFPPLIKGGQGGFTGKAPHAQRGLLNMH